MFFEFAIVAQLAERLICNQRVGVESSNGSQCVGSVAERSKATDCKSVDVSLRFKSIWPTMFELCGSSSVGRASAFQAEGRGFESRLTLTAYIAQAVEHFLGKEEVTSSSLL